MSEKDREKKSLLRVILDYIVFLVKTFCLGSFSFACLILLAIMSMYATKMSLILLSLLAIVYCGPRIIVFFWKRIRLLDSLTIKPERDFYLEVSRDTPGSD